MGNRIQTCDFHHLPIPTLPLGYIINSVSHAITDPVFLSDLSDDSCNDSVMTALDYYAGKKALHHGNWLNGFHQPFKSLETNKKGVNGNH